MHRLASLSAGLILTFGVGTTPAASQPPASEGDGSAAPPLVVAVIDFRNSSLVDHAAFDAAETGVAALLLGELQGRPGIQLVERERLAEVLDELALARSGRVDAGRAARAGRLLGAHYVVTGVIMVDPGGTLRIDARTVDVETGAIVYTESVVGRPDDLVDAVARLGELLDLGLALRSRPRREGGPGPDDLSVSRRRADLSYARALRHEDRRDPEGALAMYRVFLEVCPEVYAPELQAHARARVAQLSAGAGVPRQP